MDLQKVVLSIHIMELHLKILLLTLCAMTGHFCTVKLIFVCKMNLSSLILFLFSHGHGSGFAKLCDKAVTVFSGN